MHLVARRKSERFDMTIWTDLPANDKKLVATVVVFFIYLSIAFVFAFIYTRIFKRDPTANVAYDAR